MPNDPSPPVQVGFTPEFKRNLRKLAKKYRHIKSDLQSILDQLAAGTKLGDQIPPRFAKLFSISNRVNHRLPNPISTLMGHPSDNWKLIQHLREKNTELFNLAKDPYERSNLSAKNGDRVRQLQKAIEQWVADR